MVELATAYYENPINVINQVLHHNNIIYMFKTLNNDIISFFLINWEKHNINGIESDVIYLGLCITKQNIGMKGLAYSLYLQFTLDAMTFEKKTNKKLILYFTTVTPIVLLTIANLFENIRPDINGNYSFYDENLINQLKVKRKYFLYSRSHPFVLKKKSIVRYLQEECIRLKTFAKKYNVTILEQLGIREEEGDRLLIMCSVPNHERIEELKARLIPFDIIS
ncbi:hypothetical protein GCM10027035_18580 [Emticicia sediminis]